MRLLGLFLALLCAAETSSPQEQPPGPGQVGGGVEPRQAWMLLAGSTGRASGSWARGRPDAGRDGVGAGTALPARGRSQGKSPQAAPARSGAPAALEELLSELRLLLRGMAKERAKAHRKAWEGREKEESGEGNPQAGRHHRVEAAFHCRTRGNISIEQRAQQELRLYYIPEKEGTFNRGLGLNLTSGQYTAPVAGYYTFTATLHIVHTKHQRKGQPCGGNRLRVLICLQSRCQHNSNLKTISCLESSGDLLTISVTGVLYMQPGQYASTFVDNAGGSHLTVQSGSDFSAILLGV